MESVDVQKEVSRRRIVQGMIQDEVAKVCFETVSLDAMSSSEHVSVIFFHRQSTGNLPRTSTRTSPAE